MTTKTIRSFATYPTYADAIMALVPGARFGISENNYANIDWQGDEPLPSEDAVKSKLEELVSEYELIAYQRDRFLGYPTIHDQLEMLWDDMNNGIIPGKETSTWFAAIQEVKNNIPKP